jgi:hypothetical protein
VCTKYFIDGLINQAACLADTVERKLSQEYLTTYDIG